MNGENTRLKIEVARIAGAHRRGPAEPARKAARESERPGERSV
jgi:hypothetical protein